MNISLPTPNINADLIIMVLFCAALVYGLLLGQNRIKTLAMSVYVGIVLATQLAGPLHGFIKSDVISEATMGLILFTLPLFAMELGRKQPRGKHHGGMLMTIVLAVLTAGLAVSSGISLLDPYVRERILGESNLAYQIYALRLWWIGLVPLAVIAESFIRSREPHY